MKSKLIIVAAYSIVLLVCISTIFMMKSQLDTKDGQLERLKMLDETRQLDLKDDQTLDGFAHPDGYMVVWVKDKPYYEVMETCAHEYMHIEHGMVHPEAVPEE
ncbi:hypothetical protein KY362_04670 [Candidatus Woesearchaeota archaeon]|nr:hypothetical protein [Candidatus Woesearchaeota archaeon]